MLEICCFFRILSIKVSITTAADNKFCYIILNFMPAERIHVKYQSKKDGKDQEMIQSSTTPDPGYHMEK